MSAARILHIEDDPLDGELIAERLKSECSQWEVVCLATRGQLLAELQSGREYDLILSDYSLPGFDGLAALKLVRQYRPQLPFIFVSGAIGEDRAIESLREGAIDYVLKDRLDRLGPAVRRALDEAEQRSCRERAEQSLRDTEDRFRLLVEGVEDYAIVELDVQGQVTGWNKGGERIFGYSAGEILGQHYSVFFTAPARRNGLPKRKLATAAKTGKASHDEWLVRRNAAQFWASGTITALCDEAHKLRRFVLIVRDLTERKQLEDALRDRAQKLVESDRCKDEFLAMLAHELRNPLAPIQSAVELLNRYGAGQPSLTEPASIVARQVRHMTRLLDDLLDVSRVTHNKIQLRHTWVSISALVDRAVESCSSLAASRDHDLSVSLPAEPITVRGDADRLEQVLVNLLNNACKYTEPGGHIRLTVEGREQDVMIRVSDNGVGIPPDMLPTIFDLFAQSDRSLAHSAGGLGLGLALARRLVEMHGGRIEARSEGSGCGSDFVVYLPAQRGKQAPREWDSSAQPAAHQPPTVDDTQRLLLVDDNADALLMLASLLELEGYEVHTASDGRGALDAAERLQPDVVLLDIGLPDINGYEVARLLRAQPALRDILLVAVTGYGQAADRRRSAAAGFDHHLVKPINFNELSPLLARLKNRQSVS
jgi:PAS domain S-box-containing protein